MAHGTMPEDQLEDWMGPFIAHLNGLDLSQVRCMRRKPLS
jgi:hypothetical protein